MNIKDQSLPTNAHQHLLYITQKVRPIFKAAQNFVVRPCYQTLTLSL